MMTPILIVFLIASAAFLWFGGPVLSKTNQITKEEAIQIAQQQAVKDKVTPEDLQKMRMSVQKASYRYRIEWVPLDPYAGGFEYSVFIDSQSGKVLSSEANPLAPQPNRDFQVKEKL